MSETAGWCFFFVVVKLYKDACLDHHVTYSTFGLNM